MSIDLKNMEPIKKTKFLKGDFLDDQVKKEVLKYFNSNLDVILSDMAADTTGNKSLDSIRTNRKPLLITTRPSTAAIEEIRCSACHDHEILQDITHHPPLYPMLLVGLWLTGLVHNSGYGPSF